MIVSVSEARASLPELLDRVLAGEEITLTRHGEPVAVVVRPDALRVRRADQALAQSAIVHEMIAEGRATPLRPRSGLTNARAEELVAEMRDARSAR